MKKISEKDYEILQIAKAIFNKKNRGVIVVKGSSNWIEIISKVFKPTRGQMMEDTRVWKIVGFQVYFSKDLEYKDQSVIILK